MYIPPFVLSTYSWITQTRSELTGETAIPTRPTTPSGSPPSKRVHVLALASVVFHTPPPVVPI